MEMCFSVVTVVGGICVEPEKLESIPSPPPK